MFRPPFLTRERTLKNLSSLVFPAVLLDKTYSKVFEYARKKVVLVYSHELPNPKLEQVYPTLTVICMSRALSIMAETFME
jgi:hypothetical protein